MVPRFFNPIHLALRPPDKYGDADRKLNAFRKGFVLP
jgi:hypothetical protein